MAEMLWMAAKAFLIALVLTPIIRDISRSFHVVDRPGKRKVHAHPIPRVGGIAIAAAYGLSLVSIAGWDKPAAPSGISPWQIVPGAAIVFLVGICDDLFSLKPVWKMLGLVLAAAVAVSSGVRMGGAAVGLPIWLDYALGIFWLVLTSNALNLIDGLDGLCGGMALLSTLTLCAAALLHGNPGLACAALPLAGALAGFLCYNFHPATVFIGDSGALLVGFLLGAYGMFWGRQSGSLPGMIVPLLALSIPLLDVALSVLRRLIRGQPIFAGDRRHMHHRLLDRGLSPRRAVSVLYLAGASAAALALVASFRVGIRFQAGVVLLFCAAVWFGVSKLRYAEFDFAAHFRSPRPLNPAAPLGGLISELEAADAEDAWRRTLAREGAKLGFTMVRFRGAEGVLEEVLVPGAPRGWSLRVPLSETKTVEMEGLYGSPMASRDLGNLAGIISRTFPGKGGPAGAL